MTTTIYSSKVFNIAAAQDKINEINKRAAKKHLPGGYTYTITDSVETDEYGFKHKVFYLEISGEAPKLNGWTLAALVTYEGDKPIVDTVPGYSGEMIDRSTLDGHCDICGYDRQRNHVIVCEHPTEGRKVVGGNCVKDLLGHDLSVWPWPVPSGEDDDDWGLSDTGWHADHSVNVAHVVAVSIAATKVWGWVPRSADSGMPTADRVEEEVIGRGWAAMFSDRDYDLNESLRKAIEIAYSDDTKAEVAEVIQWAQSLKPTSEFNENMVAVAGQEFVDQKRIGILAYAFTGWSRAKAKIAEAQAEAATVVNEPLAEDGTRLKNVPATITGIKYIDGMYGTTTLVKFTTADHHKASWFASNTPVDESWIGQQVLVTGTVKGSNEWQGIVETRLTRCRIVKAAVQAA